jgi:hypothetical protein
MKNKKTGSIRRVFNLFFALGHFFRIMSPVHACSPADIPEGAMAQTVLQVVIQEVLSENRENYEQIKNMRGRRDWMGRFRTFQGYI